jgi:DNA-binding response OmpR family regulator
MRILLVEDDINMAHLVKRGLEEEGYAVDVAGNGLEGQNLAENWPYDLVILDIVLPEKNGLDVCVSLREKKVDTPILLLTCKSDVRDKVNGLNSGADDYLTKPFDIGELLARVHALLRRNKEVASVRLQAGELVLDSQSRQVWFKQELLELNAKEYAVLECLMRNPNIVLSRTQIEQRVWKQDMDNASNLVDVYIKRLRLKIGRGENNPIETVRGSGYKLKCA